MPSLWGATSLANIGDYAPVGEMCWFGVNFPRDLKCQCWCGVNFPRDLKCQILSSLTVEIAFKRRKQAINIRVGVV